MQDQYERLPMRNNNSNKCSVLTNMYEIRLERLPNQYYLYTATTDMDWRTSSLIRQHARQNRNQTDSFYQQIGFICFYQKGLLGNTDINQTCSIQLSEGQQKNNPTIVVMSKSKQITLKELVSSQQGIRFIRTTFSSPLNRITSNKQIKVTLHKHRQLVFQSSRRINLAYVYFNRKIWIATDCEKRVQEHCTLLDYLTKYTASESATLLKGAKIVKNYGKMDHVYMISIDCSKNPTHKMGNNSSLTFEEYYLQKYNIKIKELTQPLILASRRKSNHQHSPTEYLIPELVSLADRSYMPDCPQQIQNQLKQLKQIMPQQKEDSISQIIGQLGAEDIIKKSAINLEAQQLIVPSILIKNREMLPEDGIFEFRNPIRQSPQLKSWAIAYSAGNSNERQEADSLIDYFRKLTPVYGVNITSNPSSIVIQGTKYQAWQSGLQQNFKKYGKLQIVILFLKENQQKHYYPLKEYLTLKIKCPSQVICKKSMNSQRCRRPYAVAIDALLQIITKIGAVPWDVKRQTGAISSSLVMQGGLTINKNVDGYSFGLVGAAGKQQNEVFSHYKKNLKTRDDLKNQLENCLILWAKTFVVSCRSAPQTIILYSQTSAEARSNELRQLQESLFFSLPAKIGQKIKQQNYSPNSSFVNVSTNQKIEFYSREMITSDIILKNVNTGTVVYEQTGSPTSFNFYLCSKSASQTTLRPVKYEVVCSSPNLKKEELAQFTYESCYCYFNYQGAHSIPAMLQNSIKLTKLLDKFTASAVDIEDRISRLHYYL